MAGWFRARPAGPTAVPDATPAAETLPGYNAAVEAFREDEYPMLKDNTYLDHAGTTLYSRSLVDRFAADMTASLLGNPHAGSASSQAASALIEDVRLRALQFLGADPAEFDLVFVANATAGAKLVADACRAQPGGFAYAYHEACHTSLVGVRAEARHAACLSSAAVEAWAEGGEAPVFFDDDSQHHTDDNHDNHDTHDTSSHAPPTTLFAYTAQSNMDGQRYPLAWAARLRQNATAAGAPAPLVLLDAAAYCATAPLDLSDAAAAPDFVLASFYKIFGFPDLAALLVRRAAEPVFDARRYFGGGTVDVVVSGPREQWHAPRRAGGAALHERLEDGTLPVHAILALRAALATHGALFGGMARVAAHAGVLAARLRGGLAALRHGNGRSVCVLYGGGGGGNGSGPTIAFNVRNARGAWVGLAEFDKLAALRRFHIRTGGVCNPGGIAAALGLAPWEVRRNFARGLRCGGADADDDIVAGKPTGVVRASLGAMSTVADVDRFVAFVDEFFREAEAEADESAIEAIPRAAAVARPLVVASINVYPIKSCGAFAVPAATPWAVRPEGLAWDREWCLVHRGSRRALSQKQYPQMVRLRPVLDFAEGVLRVVWRGAPDGQPDRAVCVPLSQNPALFLPAGPAAATARARDSRVCGEAVAAQVYAAPAVHAFFSGVLGVPCLLARFPAGGQGPSARHAKAHLQAYQRRPFPAAAAAAAAAAVDNDSDPPLNTTAAPRILLANESPILAIHMASLRALNAALDAGTAPVPAAVFRANVVLDGGDDDDGNTHAPYAEDAWARLRIGRARQPFRLLGACRRCHMVCVDQATGAKRDEPYVTLAKTRRFDGKVFFGTHMAHDPGGETGGGGPAAATPEQQHPTITVGDVVEVEG